MTNTAKSLLLLTAVVLLAAAPLLFVQGEFGGADGAAEEMIGTLAPSYKPWFTPLMEPPAETESMLFALQAAAGAGFIGYVIGYFKGRSAKSKGTNDAS
ncbi:MULTISPECIES: energy-coupling factor ABC transporter substrate-binding protein [Paenibacillus]|uniref:energy-coupling factor ABC transporter substrate-binding protein n=1 Tax=Paenibacillus TaxID=44249 RepID=UPI0022B8E700|nr:energy-coupling factor ABC transporter substrate-binding protein [Paenibacillus caseinilyticus]MCZ8522823.1 energy-coupling factor ABC transporter substrate-binding protein [Paenibacillus caseinilyticus]